MNDRPAKRRTAARTAYAALCIALSVAPALTSSCSLFAASPCGTPSDCAGNACFEGFCTDEPAPAEQDSGHVADAGRAEDDAGSAPVDGGGPVDGADPPDDDAGHPTDDDAGSAPVDGGTAGDGGTAQVDGGDAPADGGVAPVDGGNVAEDAGDVGQDAGNDGGGPRDAGPPAFWVATSCVGVLTTETCADDDTLVLCVPFDEPPVDGGFETLEDRSQANHDVTPSNVGFAVGIEGPGARFDGSTDVVVSDDGTSLAAGSALSYEAWFFAAAPAGVAMQVIERDEQYYVELSPNAAGWDVYCGIAMPVAANNVRVLAGTVSASAWHHVACTWSSGTFRAYADGVLSTAVDTFSAAAAIGATTFVLGRNNPVATKPFIGIVDRVRVWARQLTDEEVRCAAAAELP